MILAATRMRFTPCSRSCFPSLLRCFSIRVGQRRSPCGSRYPSAQALASAGVETVATLLHELAPRNSGRKTAQQLVQLAQHTVSSGIAASARASTLKVLCDQLDHTQTNLAQLEQEIDKLLDTEEASERRAECARIRAQDGRGFTGGTGGCDAL